MVFDAKLMEVLSCCLRYFLFNMLGFSTSIFLAVQLMEKRRSVWIAWGFLLGKTIVVAIGIQTFLAAYYQDTVWWNLLNITTLWITPLLTYLAFYLVFKGGFLKTVLGLIITDFLAGFIVPTSIIAINYLEKRENLFLLAGEFQILDLLVYPLDIALVFLFTLFFGNYLKKYRTCQLKHKKLLWIFIIVELLYIPYTYKDNLDIGITYLSGIVPVGLAMGVIGFLLKKNREDMRRRQHFLKKQQQLTELHYKVVREQIIRMENSQNLIDQQMKEIMSMEDAAKRSERILSYLKELRYEYGQIRAGVYCNDWMIDSLLFSQAEKLRYQGIEFDCSMQGYDRGRIEEEELAQMLLALMDWAAKESSTISLRITCVKNQLMIRMNTVCRKAEKFSDKFSGRSFKPYLKKYKGMLKVKKKEQNQEVVLLLQREYE